MSHMRGDDKLANTTNSQARRGPPRSITTNAIARTVHTIDVHTAIFEIPPKPFSPNTRGAEEMIKPPALKPTRNMKQMIYIPHELVFPIFVTTRPALNWYAHKPMPSKATAADAPMAALRPFDPLLTFCASMNRSPSPKEDSRR